MIEVKLLHFLCQKKLWRGYADVLDWPQLKLQTPEVYKVLLSLKKWHEEKESDLGLSELPIWFFLQYPGMRDKEKEVYIGLFDQASKNQIREELILSYLQQVRDTQTRRTLALLAIDDKTPNDKILEQSQKLAVTKQEKEDVFTTTNLDDLIAKDKAEPGLLWRLECLNRSIGPLRIGMFGAILARVETGKTALWVSEVTNMMEQITDEDHICVFFNEENGYDVIWRLYSAATGMTSVEMESNPRKAKELFYSKGGRRIKFVDRAVQRPDDIYRTLDKLHPALIIIDNLDKIKGFEDDKKHTALGKKYIWGRETAKTYAPLIGISQASESGANKKWLTELDMADSKTDKPAELDFLIGIGRTEQEGYEYVRYINIPKNKRRGNQYMQEKDRHGKFQTIIVPQLSIYRDVK